MVRPAVLVCQAGRHALSTAAKLNSVLSSTSFPETFDYLRCLLLGAQEMSTILCHDAYECFWRKTCGDQYRRAIMKVLCRAQNQHAHGSSSECPRESLVDLESNGSPASMRNQRLVRADHQGDG